MLGIYCLGRAGSVAHIKLAQAKYHWQPYHEIKGHNTLRSANKVSCRAFVKGSGHGLNVREVERLSRMNIKPIYGRFLQVVTSIFGIDAAKQFDAYVRFHRKLNLKNPVTLADKVSYIELHEQSPLASECTDKFAVRDYVAQKGFAHTLVPLAGGPWTREEEVDFDSLPESFVLKATHGCKMNYFVPEKKDLDEEKCRKEMNRWMKTTYGTYSLEPHYYSIPHRIYAEQYLGDMSKLVDYKFHCLNGIPRFVLAMSDRSTNGDKAMIVSIDCFDMNWKPINAVCGIGTHIPGTGDLKKPKHFDEMVEMAKELSKDFRFVRIDLYEKEDQVFFGEMTFTPAACVFASLKPSFLTEMGNRLTI